VEEKEKYIGATTFHNQFQIAMSVQSKKMEKTIDGFKEQFQGYDFIKRD
jgi:hypothetical protein